MAHNKHVVTLVHALQAVYALLPDDEKSRQQPLYQHALGQVNALPVSPRLYDTLTDNERNVLSALVVEQGESEADETAAPTASSAAVKMEEETVHEEVNFQYASLDTQHRRTATQSTLHATATPGLAVGFPTAGGGSRPTIAAEGRVSVWTGKAFRLPFRLARQHSRRTRHTGQPHTSDNGGTSRHSSRQHCNGRSGGVGCSVTSAAVRVLRSVDVLSALAVGCLTRCCIARVVFVRHTESAIANRSRRVTTTSGRCGPSSDCNYGELVFPIALLSADALAASGT